MFSKGYRCYDYVHNTNNSCKSSCDSSPCPLDKGCPDGVDYEKEFKALINVSTVFYFVGCDPKYYHLQKELTKTPEHFLPLGKMVEILPELLIGIGEKSRSACDYQSYLQKLAAQKPVAAQRIAGLLR